VPRSAQVNKRVRPIFDAESGEFVEVAIHDRCDLKPGALIPGPAVIVEDETSIQPSSAASSTRGSRLSAISN
jgi:N-methylhydantoinase A